MDDREKLAFEFAQDVTKQLLALATGIIALTITFSHEFVQFAPEGARPWVYWAWIAFLASVAFGLWTLLALTGTLGPKQKATADPKMKATALSIRGANVTIPSSLQIAMFFLGLVLTLRFGWVAALAVGTRTTIVPAEASISASDSTETDRSQTGAQQDRARKP